MQVSHRFLHLLLGFILVLGLIIFLNSSFFSVTSYEIISTHLIAPEEFIPWQALLGKNIFHIDVGELKTVALLHPQIKSVTVKRKFPGTLVYIVDERRPIAAIEFAEEYFLVDEEGIVIEKMNFIEKNGMTIVSKKNGDQLIGDERSVQASLLNTLNLIGLLNSNIPNILSRVDIEDGQKTLYLANGGKVILAESSDNQKVAQVILGFLEKARDNSWKFDYLDLRFTDKPVFKLVK